tara:strand:+ start:2409 stop:2750 length:342 start_codon:yes stop_codon:yes gene_type:complete
MEFCKNCNNKLYIVEIDNKLFLQCKKCGYKNKNKKTIIISKTYKFVETEPDIIHNKYITFDNTLPRTNIKNCINKKCPFYGDKSKQEIVFYPDKKTCEISYVCCHCYTNWKLT